MANSLKFSSWVSLEALRRLVNRLEVADGFNRDWEEDFSKPFAVGSSIQVKLPQRWFIRDGIQYSPQPVNRITTVINVNHPFGLDFEWDDFEKALNWERSEEEIREQYIDPAMDQIAQEFDSRAALFAYQNANNTVGVLGTDPSTTTTIAQIRQRLVELGCPPGTRKLVVPPAVSTSLVPALQTLFNPQRRISRQYQEGELGDLHGFDFHESVSVYRHTAGTWASSVTVNGAGQSGSTLAINATAGDTFNVGDVFSINNVNFVNPVTRRVLTPTAKQFVVTQALTALGSGTTADVLQIAPAIFGPGSQYQNVDALPANTATMTLFPGTSSPNGKAGVNGVAFHRDAFGLVAVKIELPKAVEISSQTRDKKTGIAVRFVRAWDPINSKMINRWDCLIGFGQLYQDNCAVRILCA